MTSQQPECKISSDGTKHWWLNGERHRIDGPAVEWDDGSKHWWLNGKKLDPEEAIHDLELQIKYPALIEAMTIYLVHNS